MEIKVIKQAAGAAVRMVEEKGESEMRRSVVS